MFSPSFTTSANLADPNRLPSPVLRLNYFYVRDRGYKTKLRQRLDMEVDICGIEFNRLIFNYLYIDKSYIIRIFVMREGERATPGRAKSPACVLADWTGQS